MTEAERLADLKAKLATRERVPGYEENKADLRKEIARLEALKQD